MRQHVTAEMGLPGTVSSTAYNNISKMLLICVKKPKGALSSLQHNLFMFYFVVEDIDKIWKNLQETLNTALCLYYANIDDQGKLNRYPLAE